MSYEFFIKHDDLNDVAANYILDVAKSINCKEVHIIIKKAIQKRTNQQSRYFYGVIIVAFKELAQEQAVFGKDLQCWGLKHWKAFLQTMFLSVEVDGLPVPTLLRGTSDLTVAEFSEFIDDCRRLFLDEGGQLMRMDEQLYNETKEV